MVNLLFGIILLYWLEIYNTVVDIKLMCASQKHIPCFMLVLLVVISLIVVLALSVVVAVVM